MDVSMTDYDEGLHLYNDGRSAMEAGNYQLAVKKFEESIRIAPHFKTLESLGECLLLLNQFTEAIVYLAAAVGLGNKQFRPRYLLAKALSATSDVPGAIEKLQEALDINPNYQRARELLNELSASDA